ncbi:MAG: trehalose-phosphatase [Desulfatibacillaceae bacterium]
MSTLKERLDAFLFDLDGVLVDTAALHARAWKRMFDDYLEKRARREGTQYRPFDLTDDYLPYVDGKPRLDGIVDFLSSRGIEIDTGSPDDPPERETVHGLGRRKNEMFVEYLEKEGARVYESTPGVLDHLKKRGFSLAVVSSSKNCLRVLKKAGLDGHFDTRVDGMVSRELGLSGKPEPDIFIQAAKDLGLPVERCAVVEDAESGVEAGRRGDFGYVIAVNRQGRARELAARGADLVVEDLSRIDVDSEVVSESTRRLPRALDHIERFAPRDSCPAVFLDFDGTLSPIVDRPEDAVLSPDMRRAMERLADRCRTAVVSGRGLADVRARVPVASLYFAGSHGFEISGPGNLHFEHPEGKQALPVLDKAGQELEKLLENVSGAQVERKRFSIAVHYRRVEPKRVAEVEKAVDHVFDANPGLRKKSGKKVFELGPDVDWDKGKAVSWLLTRLDIRTDSVVPVYVGDDVTDEDAFGALVGIGAGVVVEEGAPRPTQAGYRLSGVDEVRRFIENLAQTVEGAGS